MIFKNVYNDLQMCSSNHRLCEPHLKVIGLWKRLTIGTTPLACLWWFSWLSLHRWKTYFWWCPRRGNRRGGRSTDFPSRCPPLKVAPLWCPPHVPWSPQRRKCRQAASTVSGFLSSWRYGHIAIEQLLQTLIGHSSKTHNFLLFQNSKTSVIFLRSK